MPQYGGGAVDPANFLFFIILLAGSVIIYLTAAIAVAAYAGRIGRDLAGWLIMAVIFTPPVACFLVVLFGPKVGHYLKQCPQCAEAVKAEAHLCRYCRSAFPAPEPAQ